MAKSILLKNLNECHNVAINLKRSELLKENKDLTKDAVVVAIIEEWKLLKYGSDNKLNRN